MEPGFLPLDQPSFVATNDEHPLKLSTLDSVYGPQALLVPRFASQILGFLLLTFLSIAAPVRSNGSSVIDGHPLLAMLLNPLRLKLSITPAPHCGPENSARFCAKIPSFL